MLNRELKGWYRVSVTGWVALSAYVFSGSYVLSEIQGGYLKLDPYVPASWMFLVIVLMLFAKIRNEKPFASKKSSSKGFSLIELIIVISIIGILASLALSSFGKAKEKAYFARSKNELRSMETSLQLYLDDHDGIYPADTGRNIPPGLEEYLAPGTWPGAPYPGSVYDWDNWLIGGERIYQFSIRFCNWGTSAEDCNAPDQDWAENFNFKSAIFYCIDGPCRSHDSEDYDYPGYCVNCTGEDIIRGD